MCETVVVVQYIRAVWTKASRGAPGAVVRNAVPAAVPIETAPLVGQPPRHERREAFTLSVGGYARVIVNGRHAPDEGHWYTQETYNVAFGDVIDVDTFTARPPTAVLDLRETLF